MHTQKVDLHHYLFGLIHTDVGRDSRDEPNKLVGLGDPHTSMPIPKTAWGLESPTQKLRGVVAPEHVVVVLDVILVEQYIQFFELTRVVEIKRVPLEA
jgi:hypothetical protein